MLALPFTKENGQPWQWIIPSRAMTGSESALNEGAIRNLDRFHRSTLGNIQLPWK
jgi:hypothetical protein